MSFRCSWSVTMFSSSMSLVIFYPHVTQFTPRGLQKPQITTVNLSISPFSSSSFGFVCFEALSILDGHIPFRVLCLLGELTLLSYVIYS